MFVGSPLTYVFHFSDAHHLVANASHLRLPYVAGPMVKGDGFHLCPLTVPEPTM
jgi:hypothetical protein